MSFYKCLKYNKIRLKVFKNILNTINKLRIMKKILK